jgi:metal-responsive CopG/Arc/MetJ family transcriptional regulator
MKPNTNEVMLSVRIPQSLLNDLNKLSRNKYATRSHLIRAVLQKAIDKNR